MNEYQKIIDNAWKNRELLNSKTTINCIHKIIKELDRGKIRVAIRDKTGWKVINWIKKAIIL